MQAGLPVYADAAAYVLRGAIIVREQSYPMVGALPFTVLLRKNPRAMVTPSLKSTDPILIFRPAPGFWGMNSTIPALLKAIWNNCIWSSGWSEVTASPGSGTAQL